jgi:hypothetical protein
MKLCAEASELFRQPVFQVIFFHKMVYLERILQGAKMLQIRGCLIRTVGRKRENKLKVHATASKGMASVFWTVKEFC